MAHVAFATSFDVSTVVAATDIQPRVLYYSTADFKEVGRFDTYPEDDSSDFAGAWSVYPYFKSGLIAVSSIEEGLFLVKRSESSRRLRGARV